MFWLYLNVITLLINTISIPYDNGANILGSKNAPKALIPYLNFLNIDKKLDINCNNHLTNVLGDGFLGVWSTLNENKFPLVIGGDHTVAIPSVYAVNEYCNMNSYKLGVLWCDAHADFNTMETSPSKNLHGMPVAILSGHTLPALSFGNPLSTSQFGYYGVRDIDSLEFMRFQEYNMKILDNDYDIDDWLTRFDKIHVSFDIDCLDPTVTSCVNTPVKNGKSIEEMQKLFNKVKESNKLISLDIVEYNSDKGENHTIIMDIVKELF